MHIAHTPGHSPPPQVNCPPMGNTGLEHVNNRHTTAIQHFANPILSARNQNIESDTINAHHSDLITYFTPDSEPGQGPVDANDYHSTVTSFSLFAFHKILLWLSSPLCFHYNTLRSPALNARAARAGTTACCVLRKGSQVHHSESRIKLNCARMIATW